MIGEFPNFGAGVTMSEPSRPRRTGRGPAATRPHCTPRPESRSTSPPRGYIPPARAGQVGRGAEVEGGLRPGPVARLPHERERVVRRWLSVPRRGGGHAAGAPVLRERELV